MMSNLCRKLISRRLLIFLLALTLIMPKIPVYAETPDFVLESVTVSSPSIDKGTTFRTTFTVKNISAENMTEVYMKISSTSFSVKDKGTTFKVADEIKAGIGQVVSLELICNDTQSNNIPITISYKDSSNVDKTVNDQILVTLVTAAATGTPSEITTSKYQPGFAMASSDVPTLEAGTTNQLNLKIKNISNYTAKKVEIVPQLPAELEGKVSFNANTFTPQNIDINGNTDKSFALSATVLDQNLTGNFPMTYSVSYANAYGDPFNIKLTGYLKITPIKKTTGVLVTSVATTPENVVKDGPLKLTVKVNSKLKYNTSVTYTLEGLNDPNFIYQGQSYSQKMLLVASGNNTISFNYLIKKEATSGNYPYKLKISYIDNENNTIMSTNEYVLNLGGNTTSKGLLDIENMSVPSNGVTGETPFKATFDLVNKGDGTLENIVVKFDGNAEIWSQTQGIIQIKKLVPGERKTIGYTLMGSKQTTSKNVPVTFNITYDAAEGESVNEKTFDTNSGVLILGSKNEQTAPKMLITKFITSPNTIKPGDTFDLDFSIKNTNDEKNVKNVKMIISSVDGTTQKTNLIPVGQSDSLYIAQLQRGGVSDQSVKVMIPNDFNASVCDVKVDLTFEDQDGNKYQDQEVMHLPVQKKLELTTSDVRIGKVLDNSYSLELDFYNTGKGILKNLMVDLESEYASTNSNYFVGDFQMGKMDIYSVNITGEIPKTITGNVIFTYEDNLGVKVEKKVPFDLSYSKPEPTSDELIAMGNLQEAPKNNNVSPLLIMFGAAVIVIAVFLFRKFKMRKEG